MNATKNLLTNLRSLFYCVRETLGNALTFLLAILCSRAVLAATLPAVENKLISIPVLGGLHHRYIRVAA